MGKLIDLYRYAETHGIDVDHVPMERADSLSMPLGCDNYGIAIDPRKICSTPDEYCKLAHELGHCETGSFYNRWAACDLRAQHENRANKWAVQHSISQEDLEKAVSSGYTEIYELAEYFDVTEDFMRKVVCWYKHGNLDVEHYMNF